MPAHIAIMREPYLTRVLAGQKTIESRFLRVRSLPYDRVSAGDQIGLKRVGGPISAVAPVTAVRQYADLTPERIAALVAQFGADLRLDPDFIARIRDRRYAVLIWLGAVRPLPTPIQYAKRDRRGWVTLEHIPWQE
jgi:ASC-1-like (ASCH) protein